MTTVIKESPKGEHGGRSAQGDSRRTVAPASQGYIVALVGAMVATLAAFYLTLLALLATDNLPPPAFSNSLCIDEKLRFMREHPAPSPNLLVIGSSVAWRHFDSAAVANHVQGIRPLNGAFCALPANGSEYVASWLLDRHPTVRQVLMIAAPQDFAECSKKPTVVFDREDVDNFVYGGASRWPYYLRYFSPISLVGNARKVKYERANLLTFTRFGDGPLNTTRSLETLGYGPPEPLESACFQALRSLATRLQRDGRQLMVVTTPLHPDWKAQVDPDGKFFADFDARMRAALKATNARYWDADKEWKPDRAAFTDAIHLRWSAAQEFSAALARQLRPVNSVAAPTPKGSPVDHHERPLLASQPLKFNNQKLRLARIYL